MKASLHMLPVRTLFGAAVVPLLLLFGPQTGLVARGQVGEKTQAVILPAGPFSPDLKPWQEIGKARFDADESQTRAGHRSGRITLAPDVTPAYQQFRQDFHRDIRAGDELRATVWVKSRGIKNVRGPYLALEFVDDRGQRLAIAHSGAITGKDKEGWEQLTAEGTVPSGTFAARVNLVLHAHGMGWFADPMLVRTDRPKLWPELGDRQRVVTIQGDRIVQPHLGGVGFHAFHHSFPVSRTELDEVIIKRWRELRPSFTRVNHEIRWNHAMLDQMAMHLQYMKDTGTELYVTTWDPEVTKTEEGRRAYARKVVDHLEYLVRRKGLTNIHYYCMTNEMSLSRWGSLLTDLPTFQAYHQALFDELKARGLKIGLLATDASPVENWATMTWAAENMDSITAIYGGHHYFTDRNLDDERVYPWFLGKTRWAVKLARSRGKDFVLGEFGSRQDGRTINGIHRDVCVYFDTPQEAEVTLQLADAVIAALNAGVYAMGYWTFMDLPDNFSSHSLNKWGLTRCSGSDRSTRDPYYGYALLTRYFRGPAQVVAVKTSDPRLRVAALRHGDQAWSIAVVNRNHRPVSLRFDFEGQSPPVALAKYLFDPTHVPQHAFGDLPGPDGMVTVSSTHPSDVVGPGTLTVYTTRTDTRPPAAVRDMHVEHRADGRDHLTWKPSPEPDLCYYRVYRGKTQLGSTIASAFDTKGVGDSAAYRVVAVDQEGNAGP
ncbi:MAG: hypothetical protein ACP5XB_01660 [Isosphaeraceae bacterium]